MRILMISGRTGKPDNAVSTVIYNVALELRGRGHQITTKFMDDLLPKPQWPLRLQTVEFARRVASYVHEVAVNFDLVNVHGPFGFIYGPMNKLRKTRRPAYVITLHELEERRLYAMKMETKKGRAKFRGKNRAWHRFCQMLSYQWSFKTADQCIVTNRETKIFLERHYLLQPNRVWLTRNGVSDEFFQERSFSQTIAPKLLFVGEWIQEKGIFYLAEAFATILSRIPDAQLTVAGFSMAEDAVRREFSGSAQRSLTIRSLMDPSQLPRLYSEHDIFVFPSLVEGLPLTLLQAMASGMPVVTTETSGMVDVVENLYDGLLIPPGNAGAVSAAILQLNDDYGLRQKLGTAAREKMRRFTWKQAALTYEEVFDRAIGELAAQDGGDMAIMQRSRLH